MLFPTLIDYLNNMEFKKMLKQTVYQITLTHDDKKNVTGYHCNNIPGLAIHKEDKHYWIVDHIPTGMKLHPFSFRTRQGALLAMVEYSTIGNWENNYKRLKKYKNMGSRVREIWEKWEKF